MPNSTKSILVVVTFWQNAVISDGFSQWSLMLWEKGKKNNKKCYLSKLGRDPKNIYEDEGIGIPGPFWPMLILRNIAFLHLLDCSQNRVDVSVRWRVPPVAHKRCGITKSVKLSNSSSNHGNSLCIMRTPRRQLVEMEQLFFVSKY